MKRLSAKQAKDGFGRLLDAARSEPVAVEKHGRAVAVVISVEEFERLEATEHAYWIERAEAAEKDGYLGKKASAALLKGTP